MTAPINPNLSTRFPKSTRVAYLEANRPPFKASDGETNLTSSDVKYRDGSYYENSTEWKDLSNPGIPNIWKLARIVSKNQSQWFLIGGGNGALIQIGVDASTAPGTNPVLTDGMGQINVTGAQVATGIIGANVIRTHSVALSQFNIEIQQSNTSSAKNTDLNGVSHFNEAQFTVDEGFVSTNGSGLIVWEIISANQTLEINHGYFCVSPGGNLALSLPATSTLGDIIEITLDGATSFTITQAAGQQIRYNNLETTLGAGGSIATTDQGNTIRMVAQTATRWNILSALGTLVVT